MMRNEMRALVAGTILPKYGAIGLFEMTADADPRRGRAAVEESRAKWDLDRRKQVANALAVADLLLGEPNFGVRHEDEDARELAHGNGWCVTIRRLADGATGTVYASKPYTAFRGGLGLVSAFDGRTPCRLPPPGWRCTRGAGHGGPCAAEPADEADHGPLVKDAAGNVYDLNREEDAEAFEAAQEEALRRRTAVIPDADPPAEPKPYTADDMRALSLADLYYLREKNTGAASGLAGQELRRRGLLTNPSLLKGGTHGNDPDAKPDKTDRPDAGTPAGEPGRSGEPQARSDPLPDAPGGGLGGGEPAGVADGVGPGGRPHDAGGGPQEA